MINAGTQTSALYKTIPAPPAACIHLLTAIYACCIVNTNLLHMRDHFSHNPVWSLVQLEET